MTQPRDLPQILARHFKAACYPQYAYLNPAEFDELRDWLDGDATDKIVFCGVAVRPDGTVPTGSLKIKTR